MSDLGGSGTALNIDNITPTSRGERVVDTTLEGTGNVSATRNSAAEGAVHSSEPRGNFQQLASNDTGVQSFGSSTQSIEALLLQRTETLLNSLRSDATRPTLQCDNMLVPLLISAGYDDAAIMQTLLQHVRSEGDGTRVALRAGTAMRQPYTPFGTAPPHSSHTATGPHTSFLPAGSAANSPANLQGTVDGFGPGPGARAVAQGGDPPGDVGASRVNQGTPFRANPPPLQAVSNTSSLLDAAVPRLDQGAALASGGGVDGCKPRGIAFQTSCLGAATGLHGPSVSFLHPNVPQMGSAASPTCIALGVSPSSMVGDLIGDCSGAGGGAHLPGGGGQPEDPSSRDTQVVQSPDQMAQTAHDLVSRFESLLQTVQPYMRVEARQFGEASFSAGYDGHAALRELLSFHQHRPDIQKLAVIVNQACKLINTSTTPILALAMCAASVPQRAPNQPRPGSPVGSDASGYFMPSASAVAPPHLSHALNQQAARFADFRTMGLPGPVLPVGVTSLLGVPHSPPLPTASHAPLHFSGLLPGYVASGVQSAPPTFSTHLAPAGFLPGGAASAFLPVAEPVAGRHYVEGAPLLPQSLAHSAFASDLPEMGQGFPARTPINLFGSPAICAAASSPAASPWHHHSQAVHVCLPLLMLSARFFGILIWCRAFTSWYVGANLFLGVTRSFLSAAFPPLCVTRRLPLTVLQSTWTTP